MECVKQYKKCLSSLRNMQGSWQGIFKYMDYPGYIVTGKMPKFPNVASLLDFRQHNFRFVKMLQRLMICQYRKLRSLEVTSQSLQK